MTDVVQDTFAGRKMVDQLPFILHVSGTEVIAGAKVPILTPVVVMEVLIVAAQLVQDMDLAMFHQ